MYMDLVSKAAKAETAEAKRGLRATLKEKASKNKVPIAIGAVASAVAGGVAAAKVAYKDQMTEANFTEVAESPSAEG